MNRFLKNISLFALIIILLLAAGEFVVRRIPTSYSVKADWMDANAGRVATLVLGSSHTYYAVMPRLLGDSTFNLANISQTPEYDYALLKEYMPQMPHLKRVVLPISYFSYRDPLLEEMSPGLCVNYKVGMHLPLHSDFSRYNFVISDFQAYAGRLRGLVLKQESNMCDSLGFGLGFSLDHRDPAWQQKGKQRAQELTQPAGGRAGDVQRMLERIVALCRQNGVECVLVTTPAWHTFRENVDTGQYDEAAQMSKEIARRYGLRSFSWYDDARFTEEDFHDSDHLSDVGARKFTLMLRDSLQN